MRLIDANKLKEKLLHRYFESTRMKENQEVIAIRDAIRDAILDAYDKGYSKGREDILEEQQLMKDYCKNDCDAIYEAYNKAYSEGDKNE